MSTHVEVAPSRSRVDPAAAEEVRAQIERYGTYAHTEAELAFGARAAWRNSSRCIGRLADPLRRLPPAGRDRHRGSPPGRLHRHRARARLAGRTGPLGHPHYEWFADLELRWHAVPAISDMCLEIGGICYPAAPFNGWYMGTEIGARNLADVDRYDLLPAVAERLGLDVDRERSLWRDRVLVELNIAVLHSFDAAGVTIADHHTESRRFLTHLAREERAGRITPADWTWIVPPISGAATPVFHRSYHTADLRPNYVHHT
jgi:nitric oxide synthase oxygenase domain/subunit